MKLKNLRYKIDDLIYEPREILRVERDGAFFFLEANKVYAPDGLIQNETVRCPIELVEVEEVEGTEG